MKKKGEVRENGEEERAKKKKKKTRSSLSNSASLSDVETIAFRFCKVFLSERS